MDTAFREHGATEFEPVLSVLATVTSLSDRAGIGRQAIIDMGRKSMDTSLGLPEVKRPAGATVVGLSQEHGRVRLDHVQGNVRIGDKIELFVRDANGTVNTHPCFYAVRSGIVEAVWSIPSGGGR
jgi:D-serine deaminase-like pyridoxal phosphate-dependent protein